MNEYKTNIKSLDKQPNLVMEKYAKLIQNLIIGSRRRYFHEFFVLYER